VVPEGVQLRSGGDVPELQATAGEGHEHLVHVCGGVAEGRGVPEVAVATFPPGSALLVGAPYPSPPSSSEVQHRRRGPERAQPPPHQGAAEGPCVAHRRRREEPVPQEQQAACRRGGVFREAIGPLDVDAVALDDALVAAGREGGVTADGEGGDGARELAGVVFDLGFFGFRRGGERKEGGGRGW
jgi:hypothetical protein